MNTLFILIIILTILIIYLYIYYNTQKHIELFINNEIHLFNGFHLGDCIFMMIYLIKIKDYLEHNNITVHFYILDTYIKQVSDFIPNKHVIIHKYDEKPENAIDTWIRISNNMQIEIKEDFLTFLHKHSNIIANKTNLPKIDSIIYDDPDLNIRYKKLNSQLHHNVDILIINSLGQSSQADNLTDDDWRNLIENLNKNYKIITTRKVENIPCTLDNNLSIKDIAAIATHAKYVIAIGSGPLSPCFSSEAMKNVKKWYIFDNNVHYSGLTIKHIKSLNEVSNELL